MGDVILGQQISRGPVWLKVGRGVCTGIVYLILIRINDLIIRMGIKMFYYFKNAVRSKQVVMVKAEYLISGHKFQCRIGTCGYMSVFCAENSFDTAVFQHV